MQRVPSIHITEKELVLVLQEVFKDITWDDLRDLPEVARRILDKAKIQSLSNRVIIVSNDKLFKKTEKLKVSGRSNASLFAQTLLLVRRKLKHRGIQLIQPGTDNWLQLKEVCKLATDFCNEFGIGLKEGYRQYCEVGMGMIKNFSLNKFKTVHASICKIYEAKVEIDTDKFPYITRDMITYYLKKVNEKIGWVSEDFKNNPVKYACFVRARQECQKIGVKWVTYIDAQFAGMEWANAIPDPYQLYGEKAVDRVMKFCYENNIVVKAKSKKVDFSKIKKHGKNSSK